MRLLPCVAGVVAVVLAACSSPRHATLRDGAVHSITLDEYVAQSGGNAQGSAAGTNSRHGTQSPAGVNAPGVDAVLRAARSWIGTPYKYGGTSRSGIDCSALTMNSYMEGMGKKIPRTSVEQMRACRPVAKDKLQPGDLVFFSSARSGNGVAHVALYAGNGDIIHASTSRGVVCSRLSDKYYTQHYIAAGRVVADNMAATSASAGQSSQGHAVPQPDEALTLGQWMEQMSALDRMLDAVIDSIYAVPDDIE